MLRADPSLVLAPSPLVFQEDGHLYFLDGRPVVGVTGALKVLTDVDYRFVDPELMARKALFGQAVHRMIELDCLGRLDLVSLDEQLEPYYLAWRAFLQHSGFEPLLSECKVWSRKWQVAGTLDLFGRLNGIPSLIDAKCVAALMPSTGPQTAAYEALLRECQPAVLPPDVPCRRYALQLRPPAPDATHARWRLAPFTDAGDLPVFLSCLRITTWRKSLERQN